MRERNTFHSHTRRKTRRKRRGITLVLSAIVMIVLMAMLALSLDIGYVCLAKTQLDRSVDAAALAGAASLQDGTAAARETAVEYLVRNPVGRPTLLAEDDELAQLKAEFLAKYDQELEVNLGHWDPDTRSMQISSEDPSALHVTITYPDLPFFFARVLGADKFAVQAEAVAMYQPRDIMVVLDFSASMNDDSELSAIDTLGHTPVVDNIRQMWTELGAQTYGVMDCEPEFVTIPGIVVPASVTWRGDTVDVSASSEYQAVRVFKSDGTYRDYEVSGTEGSFTFDGNVVYKCQVLINEQVETFDFFNNDHIRRGLELDGVEYPSTGSWDDYIEYARNHSSSMPWYDSQVYNAGFRRKFGGLTLVNFWNKNRPMTTQTPGLWKASAQPVTAVKNALDLFVDHIRAVDTNDRLGLAVYNSSSGDGTVESVLTHELETIATIARHRQAGHYHRYTNIGAGMQKAREELELTGRTGAKKMMVLMTDGRANWFQGGYDTTAARNQVLAEAEFCRAAKIPIVTISLGAGADSELMATVAELTEGTHFNVPGGASVAEYSAELLEVFRQIAKARPLRLVL